MCQLILFPSFILRDRYYSTIFYFDRLQIFKQMLPIFYKFLVNILVINF